MSHPGLIATGASRSLTRGKAETGRLGRRALKAMLATAELAAKRRPGPRILIYHQVGANLGREMEVATEIFMRQLEYLEAQGSIVTLEDAVSRIGQPGDNRLFVLTFDDGYADIFLNALPLLLDRNIPFTLYLTTQPFEDSQASLSGASPLTWRQVAEMVESGLATIGAHTHSHPDLRFLGSDEVAAELDMSNTLIQDRLGVDPRHFAYPKGWWSAGAELEVRKRYTTAVLGEGPPNTSGTEHFRLHRVAVQKSDGFRFFKRKLDTGLVLEDRLRRVVRRYEGPPDVGDP